MRTGSTPDTVLDYAQPVVFLVASTALFSLQMYFKDNVQVLKQCLNPYIRLRPYTVSTGGLKVGFCSICGTRLVFATSLWAYLHLIFHNTCIHKPFFPYCDAFTCMVKLTLEEGFLRSAMSLPTKSR